jgi:probable phosphoglycerate mutase
MPPLVYVVRHGQTDWNAEYRLQGQADTDLNATGRRQASANGRRLAGLIDDPAAFDFVASPMLRTRHTMELIRSAMGLDPAAYRTDSRLMEINFGDWQGFTFAELEADYPGAYRKGLAGDTVCVTHGGVIRALFRLAGGLSKDGAAAIEIPQDQVLRMSGGRLDWL